MSEHTPAATRERIQSETDQLIAPGHTLASITEKIASLALKRRTPLGWFVGFDLVPAAAGAALHAGRAAVQGRRRVGHQRARRLGLRHHQPGLVDRHRPRRKVDFADPLLLRQDRAPRSPLRRGRDVFAVACAVDLPDLPYRPALAGRLLA